MTTVHAVSSAGIPPGRRVGPGLSAVFPNVASAAGFVVTKGAADACCSRYAPQKTERASCPSTLPARGADPRGERGDGGARPAGTRRRLPDIGERPVGRPRATLEEGLTFLGLVGMIDPPRPGIRWRCGRAAKRIRAVMITGTTRGPAPRRSAIAGDRGDDTVVTGDG